VDSKFPLSIGRRIASTLVTAFFVISIIFVVFNFVHSVLDSRANTDVRVICKAALETLNTSSNIADAMRATELFAQLISEKSKDDLFPYQYTISSITSAVHSEVFSSSHFEDLEKSDLRSLYSSKHSCTIGKTDSSLATLNVSVTRSLYPIGIELTYFFKNIFLYLVFAIPFFILPIWVASKVGLRPLVKVSNELKQRRRDDLSPTGIKTEYAEVQPLIGAIDDLLSVIRSKVERERAFIHEAAHELRTPIAVISAQAHILKRADDNHQRHEASCHLDRAVERSNHLIEQLLTLANLENQTSVMSENLDIVKVIQNNLALLANQPNLNSVELDFESPSQLIFPTNEFLFTSIIQNVVGNAIKYSPANGHVFISTYLDKNDLVVRVDDTGPGIPDEYQELVFEKFYRIAKNGLGVNGAGLGLSIVAVALKKLGGTVTISNNNPGCRFTITLLRR